jgi:DNA polymerase-3 subunit alpha
LEDDVAGIEVMVWPRTYESTKDLWEEGGFLRIEGKVKVKEERLQITCDAVEQCKQEVQPKAATLTVKPNSAPKQNGYVRNGKSLNGNGGVRSNGSSTNGKNGKAIISPVEFHKLTIVVHETTDEEKDEAYLNQIMEILKETRGKDEVNLRIMNPDRVTNLKLTNTYVDYSPDLQKRLAKLVGEQNLIVEKTDHKNE